MSLGSIDYADAVKFTVNLPEESASYTYLVSGKNGAGTDGLCGHSEGAIGG